MSDFIASPWPQREWDKQSRAKGGWVDGMDEAKGGRVDGMDGGTRRHTSAPHVINAHELAYRRRNACVKNTHTAVLDHVV